MLISFLTERDNVNDQNAYSKMTETVGAPVDGLMARGGLAIIEHRAPPATGYCPPYNANTNWKGSVWTFYTLLLLHSNRMNNKLQVQKLFMLPHFSSISWSIFHKILFISSYSEHFSCQKFALAWTQQFLKVDRIFASTVKTIKARNVFQILTQFTFINKNDDCENEAL